MSTNTVPLRFMPGAEIREVPGVGTFGVFDVGGGRDLGSSGVQVQFAPVGGAVMMGHLSFRIRLTEGRSFETYHSGGSLSVSENVLEAAGIVADDRIRGRDVGILFNLLTVVDQGIDDIETKRRDLKGRADGYAFRLMKDRNLPESERTLSHEMKDRLERASMDYDAESAAPLAHLQAYMKDIRKWSSLSGKRPPIMEMLGIAEPDAPEAGGPRP
jgi:hypothetical protein